MAALRYAARRIAGQPPQAIFRALVSPAVAEERRRLLPRVIQGGSPAVRTYSRPFSFQPGQANRPTIRQKLEAGIEVAERGIDVMKILFKIVVSVIAIRISCSELASPGYVVCKAASLVKNWQDMLDQVGAEGQNLKAEVNSLDEDNKRN